MKVRVRCAGAVGTLLGGLLAAANHDVAFTPEAAGQPTAGSSRPTGRSAQPTGTSGKPTGGSAKPKRRQLRIVLPGGWLRVTVAVRGGPLKGEDLVLVAGGGDPRGGKAGVALLQGTMLQPPVMAARDPRYVPGVPLMTVVQLETGEVELASRRACLVLQNSDSAAVQTFRDCLREAGLEVAFVEKIEGYADSWFLCRLLLLPLALCHSTWDHFLSYPQGREIARHVLEEGIQTVRRLGRQPARLPFADPQELLEAIRREDGSLDALRFAPGRDFNELLQGILRGEKADLRDLNERLVRLASQAGTDPQWNWRLARRLGRLQQGVFFRSPAELYEAIR